MHFMSLFFLMIVGGDVYTVPIAAPEEPSWLCMYHQGLTPPQLQKWNPTDICKYMAADHRRFFFLLCQGLWS